MDGLRILRNRDDGGGEVGVCGKEVEEGVTAGAGLPPRFPGDGLLERSGDRVTEDDTIRQGNGTLAWGRTMVPERAWCAQSAQSARRACALP